MACRPDNCPKTLKLSTQTQCTECKYEIQSMLRKVQGVYSITLDADRNTIIISGNLPPKALLEALQKVSQNGDFCQMLPAHIPPSSCPANRPACGSCACSGQCRLPNGLPIRVCSPKHACCTAPKRCCACNAARKAACLPYHPGHGRC